jgi:endonuclease YncB( thermonuclease family)
MKKFYAAAVLAAAFMAAPAAAQNTGDWVLSQWQGSSQYFPGVVTARDGNTVTVRFDDNTVERRPANLIRPFDWRAGSHVECRFTDGNWYGATITRIASDGFTMSVRYDDGDTQNTNTGRCRVN